MKTKFALLIFSVLIISCSNSQKQEKNTNVSQVNRDFFLNYQKRGVDSDFVSNDYKQINSCNGKKILYNEIIDATYDSTLVIQTTHLIFKTKKNDSICISYNDSVFFQGRKDYIANPSKIILEYNEKYKRISSGIKGYFFMNRSNINVFKICFLDRNSYLKFDLKKYTEIITIVENEKNQKWDIVYSNYKERNGE